MIKPLVKSYFNGRAEWDFFSRARVIYIIFAVILRKIINHKVLVLSSSIIDKDYSLAIKPRS